MSKSFGLELVIDIVVETSLAPCTEAQPTTVALDAHVPVKGKRYRRPQDCCEVEAIMKERRALRSTIARVINVFSAAPRTCSRRGGSRPYAGLLRVRAQVRAHFYGE